MRKVKVILSSRRKKQQWKELYNNHHKHLHTAMGDKNHKYKRIHKDPNHHLKHHKECKGQKFKQKIKSRFPIQDENYYS